jgi:hypothetical protein
MNTLGYNIARNILGHIDILQNATTGCIRSGDKKYVFLSIKEDDQKLMLGTPKRWQYNFRERLKDENPGGGEWMEFGQDYFL